MGKSINNEIFNIGSDWNPSIFDIAKLIKYRCYKLFNFNPEIATPYPNKEVIKFTYSVDKLRKVGFESNYLLDDLDDLRLNYESNGTINGGWMPTVVFSENQLQLACENNYQIVRL